ncbi:MULTISPECIES: Arm DNA-binding domain-containing protein [unclassified Colwellia]|uniref:Arm DNA-binding domain-containing protein n=1 Tax=unclassified Colwellia TaxID=196834 RepID=UPI0030D72CF9
MANRDSLSVRILEFGIITFQYCYRYHDKPSRIALGRYPDISLKKAREKIPELRQLLNDGFNPAVQKKRSKATRNATLDECIDFFMKKHVTTLREVSQGNYQLTLVLHGKNSFKFPVEEVTIPEWFQLFVKWHS